MHRFAALVVFVALLTLAGSAGAQECYTYGSLRGCGDRAPARAAPTVKPKVSSAPPGVNAYYSSSLEDSSNPFSDGTNAMQFGNTLTLPNGQSCATVGTRFLCR